MDLRGCELCGVIDASGLRTRDDDRRLCEACYRQDEHARGLHVDGRGDRIIVADCPTCHGEPPAAELRRHHHHHEAA